MFRSPLLPSLLLGVFLLLADAARADVLVLKDGRRIEGKIVAETPDRVTVRLKSGADITKKKADIATIERDTSISPEESDADTALTSNNFERAVELYEAALRMATDDAIRARLGEKIAVARQRIRERDEEIVRQQLVVFEDLLGRRSYARAEEVLAQIEKEHSDDAMFAEAVRRSRARIHYAKARDARNAVNGPLAEREVMEAIRISDDYFDAQLLAGQIYLDRSELAPALEHFLAARRVASPETPAAALDELDYQVGTLLYQLGRFGDALPYFTRLRTERPDSFAAVADYEIQCLSRLGDFYLGTGELEKAIEMYQKAIETDGEHRALLGIRKRLGELYLGKVPPEPERALDQFLALQRESMTIPDLFYLIARCYMAQGETEAAIQALESEIRLNPANYNAYIDLASLYVDTGRYSRAQARLEDAIKANPDPYQAYLILGRLRRLEKRYDDAKRFLNQVLAKDETVFEASLLLGLVSLDEKDFDEAADFFDRVIREYEARENRTPTEVEVLAQAYNARGQVDLEKQQVRLALDRFEKARALMPDLADTYNNMGQAQRRLTNYKRAEELYRRALELAPSNPDYHLQLGLLYHNNLEDPDRAIEAYNKYFDLGGQDYTSVNKWLEELGAQPRRQAAPASGGADGEGE